MGRRRNRPGLGWTPRVTVRKPRQGRLNWVLWWTDQNGIAHESTTDLPALPSNKEAAQREAIRLEYVLANTPLGCPLDHATERYLSLALADRSDKARQGFRTVLGHISDLFHVRFVEELTTAKISELSNALLGQGRSPASVASYLRSLRAFLNWCKRQEIIADAPMVEMPQGGPTKRSEGRDITYDELESLLDACDIARPKQADAWRNLLWGLWLTGFRVGELVSLHWETGPVQVDLSRQYPGFLFQPEGHKNRKEQWVPMVPAFYERFVKSAKSQGYVIPIKGNKGQIKAHTAIDAIAEIGAEAGVVVSETGKTATSKDIGRRSFATHWQGVLSDRDLADLMRHGDPRTTFAHYVGGRAMGLAEKIWTDKSMTSEGECRQ